jgi:mannan endo-1,4-beta-mannosidase
VRDTRRMVETVRQLGQAKCKVYALTETGLGGLPKSDWWMQSVLPIVHNAGLSYVLVWRNNSARSCFTPYPGHPDEADFKAFSQSPEVLFLGKAAAQHFYEALAKK